jgi:hypothetical protein
MFGMFQTAIAAVTDSQDIEARLFGEGKISGRRKQVGPEVDVSERISAAVEVIYIDEFYPKFAKDHVR